jgi:DNA-binding transcriptional MerR regulator
VLLKVGELAKRTGLTVRALHHYDSIGLLKPSGRSESGYRLYNQSDLARLHGIQALQQLGLPLADISRLFEEDAATLPMIISRQIQMLDEEMANTADLRNRLALIQDRITSGINSGMEEWLSTLNLMATFRKYFNMDELRGIFSRWNQLLAEWHPLIADIRSAMNRDMPASSNEAQILARRWIELSLQWMEGDFELLKRWGNMRNNEPNAHLSESIDAELFGYINKAVHLRLEAFHRHLEPSQISRFNIVPEQEWTRIGVSAERLIRRGVAAESDQAMRLANRWSKLIDRLTDNDPQIRERLLAAIENEPVLQVAMTVSREAQDYIREAHLAAQSSKRKAGAVPAIKPSRRSAG